MSETVENLNNKENTVEDAKKDMEWITLSKDKNVENNRQSYRDFTDADELKEFVNNIQEKNIFDDAVLNLLEFFGCRDLEYRSRTRIYGKIMYRINDYTVPQNNVLSLAFYINDNYKYLNDKQRHDFNTVTKVLNESLELLDNINKSTLDDNIDKLFKESFENIVQAFCTVVANLSKECDALNLNKIMELEAVLFDNGLFVNDKPKEIEA